MTRNYGDLKTGPKYRDRTNERTDGRTDVHTLKFWGHPHNKPFGQLTTRVSKNMHSCLIDSNSSVTYFSAGCLPMNHWNHCQTLSHSRKMRSWSWLHGNERCRTRAKCGREVGCTAANVVALAPNTVVKLAVCAEKFQKPVHCTYKKVWYLTKTGSLAVSDVYFSFCKIEIFVRIVHKFNYF